MSLTLAAAIKSLIRGFKHSKLKKADLRIGQQLNLLPDNENRHDANAIAVKTSDGDHIGHVAKEFAFVFRKLIDFAIRRGVLIVGALKGVEHGRFNELLFEVSFFVGNVQMLTMTRSKISKLIQDCALRSHSPSIVAPTESPQAAELIRLRRELATAKEQIGATKLADDKEKVDAIKLAADKEKADAVTAEADQPIDHSTEKAIRTKSAALRQLQKIKREQADVEDILRATKKSLYRANRELRDTRHELARLRYHINTEQMKPKERDESVIDSDKKKRRLQKLIDQMCDDDSDD